jgi:4-hydroxybenzoate polyprenyltransferase|tara:strand:+ start:81 stop:938 length:858 start_codon:yes stop_codon:yes gene_type:complete
MHDFLKLIRFSQWPKNFLIFLPFIMANEYSYLNIYTGIIGFFIFSLAASTVYIFNDLLDLPLDRIHPTKKNRPIASNSVSKNKAKFILLTLMITSLYFGFINNVILILLVYFFLNILYTLVVKKIKFLDIILLSSFYIIRIYFGGELTEIENSIWLYIFSILAFMSLVILKRVNEIKKYRFKTNLYSDKNFKNLKFTLILSNYTSLVFLFFFTLSDKVIEIYDYPKLLWVLLPLFFYWTKNINNFALNGKMNDDPVQFVLTNKKSLIIIILMSLIILIAQLISST